MRSLTRDTVLVRRTGLRLEVDSSNHVRATRDGLAVQCGPHGLAVLDAFARPASLAEVLDRLAGSVAGRQDWVDLVGTVEGLRRAGMLAETGGDPGVNPVSGDYDAVGVHVEMLDDRARTAGFVAAVAGAVSPGDVVVDVGTGTGILAVAAARAGARRVYAIEASGIASVAAAVFRDNGVAERITLVREWSTRVTLPEPADVVVSEMIGHQPLGEKALEVTADAVRRLARPGARLVPSRVEVFGLPVAVPDDFRREHACTAAAVADWRDRYGVDLGAVARAAGRETALHYVKPQRARGWPALADPVALADVDLAAGEPLLVDRRVRGRARAAGHLDALLVYFELALGPGTRLSTHPAAVEDSNHWYCPLWLAPAPLSVAPGDGFEVAYRYAGGEESCEIRAAGGTARRERGAV